MSPNAVALLTLLAFAIAVPALILALTHVLGRPRRGATDLTPYECGAKPFESARRRFSVRFYIVAMLFILFDVEAAFFYPWAVALKDQARSSGSTTFVLGSMLVFLGVVAVGYAYAWGRGALDWDR
jgi:NADH-quinone oxidoreductase subunit A